MEPARILVKITLLPWQEAIIHNVEEYENTEFFRRVVTQALGQFNPQMMSLVPPEVNWIDGIAFIAGEFPPTEDVVQEKLAGKIHISTALFTRMQYKESFTVTLGNQSVPVKLNRQNVNSLYLDLVEFLKGFQPDPRIKARIQSAT